MGELRRVADMLPALDQLVLRDDTVKVTLAPTRRSVDFFKRQAAKQQVPYQRMIRALGTTSTRGGWGELDNRPARGEVG